MTPMKASGGIGLLLKLFGVWVTGLLLFQNQSLSVAGSAEDEEAKFPSDVYNRLLSNCQSKLEAWSAESSTMSNASSIRESLLDSSSGVFMRGRWWRQTDGVGDNKIPPSSSSNSDLFQGSGGKFDFFSSGITISYGRIQNFSASIFISNAKGNPRGPILQLFGILNVQTGESCLVGCRRALLTELEASSSVTNTKMSPTGAPRDGEVEDLVFGQDRDQDCGFRGDMNFVAGKDENHLKMEGTMWSMRKASDPGWFVPIRMSGKLVNDLDQKTLYRQEVAVNSVLYIVEAGLVVWQIVYSIKSSSGYFVSVLAILVQIVVLSFTAARFLYIPLHTLSYREEFKYLFTSLALVPCFLVLLLMLIYGLFLSLILRKRRMARRSNLLDRPHELRLAAVCLILYGIIGVLLWSLESFTAYLQVVWSLFLLPQVIANVFWDLRTKPLHPVYSVGLSLCRIIFTGYDSLRPTIYGYDDINEFPQGWFWGISLPVVFLLVYSFLQQRYGGRCLLPQSWFGYQLLPHSNSEATQQESLPKPEDQMLTL